MAGSKLSTAMAAQARDPKSRFLIIVGLFVTVVGLSISFYTLTETQTVSTGASLSTTPEVESIPGELSSPFYESILSRFNEEAAERALQEGRGFVPVLQGQLQIDTNLTLPLPPAPVPQIVESKPEVPEPPSVPGRTAMLPPTAPAPLPVEFIPPPPPAPIPQPLWVQADQNLAGAMQSQIGGLIGGWQPQSSNSIVFYVPGNRPSGQTTGLNGSPQIGTTVANPQPAAPAEPELERLIKPGQIVFARMVTRAVSTKPGPVLAELVGGELNGARLIGDFAQRDDVLLLNFSTLVFPDGSTTGITATAVDPADGTTGLATGVDRFFFERFVVAAAAAFISEFAESASDPESSVIINVGGGGTTTQETEEERSFEESILAGVSDAADVVTDEIDDNADRYERPEVTIAQGTLFGLLFTEELVGPAPR